MPTNLLRLILPVLASDPTKPRPRLSLAEMAAAARGVAGTPGCRNCGGKLTKTVNGQLTCAHCGRPRRAS